MDTAANLLQLYGADVRGAVAALLVAILVSLGKDYVPDSFWREHQALLIWGRVTLAVVLAIALVCLLSAGRNVVLNGSFTDAAQHWGTGYYEDLLRNGNWDTPETNTNYRKAMSHFPYVLHMPRPARQADTDPVPDARGDLDFMPGRYWGGDHAFRIEFASDEGANRFGTLSQRLANLTPHSNYLLRFKIRAEAYTPGALFVTTALNWKACAVVELARLNEWQAKECRFTTDDTDQVDLRFVVRKRARLWITDIDVRRE